MAKSIAPLAITLLFALSGEARERKEYPCRLRFAVVEDSSRDNLGVWPEDAKKWWSEEGKKKFPELCETTSQGADFVIAWLRKQSTETHSRQIRDEPWTYERLHNNDCDTSPSQTTCTPQPMAIQQSEDYNRSVDRISATAYQVGKGHFERVASVTKTGYDGMDRPGRASFRSVMKALKKKARGPTRVNGTARRRIVLPLPHSARSNPAVTSRRPVSPLSHQKDDPQDQ